MAERRRMSIASVDQARLRTAFFSLACARLRHMHMHMDMDMDMDMDMCMCVVCHAAVSLSMTRGREAHGPTASTTRLCVCA